MRPAGRSKRRASAGRALRSAWRGHGGEEGLTLVEMLIALLIFSLLMAMAFIVVTSGVTQMMSNSRRNSAQAQSEQLAPLTAAVRAMAVNPASPTEDLITLACPFEAVFGSDLSNPSGSVSQRWVFVYLLPMADSGQPDRAHLYDMRLDVLNSDPVGPYVSPTCPSSPPTTDPMAGVTGARTIMEVADVLYTPSSTPLLGYYKSDVNAAPPGVDLATQPGCSTASPPPPSPPGVSASCAALTSDVALNVTFRALSGSGGTRVVGPSATYSTDILVRDRSYATSGSCQSPYSCAVMKASPGAYWKLDDTSGTTALDSSGTGANGEIGSSVTLGISPGPIASDPAATAMGFVGTATSIITTPYEQYASTGYTVEAWIKTSATANQMVIVGDRGSGGNGLSLTLSMNGAPSVDIPGSLGFGVDSNGIYIGQVNTSLAPLDNGNWHFVVGTWTSGGWGVPLAPWQFALYVDGNLVAGQPIQIGSSSPPLQGAGGTTIGTNSMYTGSGSYWNNFQGDIAQVAVYGYALTPGQIAAEYAAATS